MLYNKKLYFIIRYYIIKYNDGANINYSSPIKSVSARKFQYWNNGKWTDDMDGYYMIINIPPGAYNVTYSMIGYKIVTVEGIRVNVDRTTNQSIALATEVVAGEEVVIEAERPLVEMDRTSTASYIDAETISELPVQEVSQIIELQAGVVTGNDGAMHFRGGRSREVAYLVDGVPVSDVFSQGGGSTLQIENSVVLERC